VRSFNLSTLKKEGREEPGRAMQAPKFKLPPERSPDAYGVIGKRRRNRSQGWESGIHKRYYCKTPHKSYGAYRAVVGTRGYYNKYGLRLLGMDPRPLHDAMGRAPLLEDNALGRSHTAESGATHMRQESHWSRPQETPHAPSVSSWRTDDPEQETRHPMHSMAAEDSKASALAFVHITACEARGDPIPAHATGMERAERLPDQHTRQEHRTGHMELVSTSRSERVEYRHEPQSRVSAPQHGPERTARIAVPEIRADAMTARAIEAYGASAARGPDALAVPENASAQVPVYISPIVQAPGLVAPQPAVSAAKMDTPAASAVFVEYGDAAQGAPAAIQAAPGCPKPGMWDLKVAGVRRASEVYIGPRIRRKVFRAVVGAEALPD